MAISRTGVCCHIAPHYRLDTAQLNSLGIAQLKTNRTKEAVGFDE